MEIISNHISNDFRDLHSLFKIWTQIRISAHSIHMLLVLEKLYCFSGMFSSTLIYTVGACKDHMCHHWEHCPLWREKKIDYHLLKERRSNRKRLSVKVQWLSSLLWGKFKSASYYSSAAKSGSFCRFVLLCWWSFMSVSVILPSCTQEERERICVPPSQPHICIQTLFIFIMNFPLF